MPPIHPCAICQFLGRCDRSRGLDDLEGVGVDSRFQCRSKVCCARGQGMGFLEISAYQTVLTVVVVVEELVAGSQGAHVDSVVLRSRVSLRRANFEKAK